MHHELIRQIMLELGEKRGCSKSFCPSEAARRLVEKNPQLGAWRDWMEAVRADARQLEEEGKLEFLQRGRRISSKPADFSGPIRLRWLDRAVEKPDHVKEERRGKANGIDTVEDTAVPFDQSPIVFHAPVALDGRHGQAASEPRQRDS